jgi:squalene-hopene/tetraprenyl-beta-curcumene cyclase
MGLMSCGQSRPEVEASLERGALYLRATQLPDGSWYDEPWTGTGFPRVFYLRYHYYAVYFPLQALALYARSLARAANVEAAA